MCANFAQNFKAEHLAALFSLTEAPHFAAHQQGPKSVFPNRDGFIFVPSLGIRSFMWGLLPRGAKDNSVALKYATFNARAETVSQSRLYKPAWNDGNRCVIPVTNYTEWRGEKGKKEKLFIRERDKEITLIAGLYDSTEPGKFKEGDAFQTFTMLTCEPNEFSKAFHHRMPVILDDWRGWLNPDLTPEEAQDFLRPFSGEMEFVNV